MKTLIKNSIRLHFPIFPGMINLFSDDSKSHGKINTHGLRTVANKKVMVHFSYLENDVKKSKLSQITLPEFTTIEKFKADVLALLNAELA
jgi:hypothetical protein